MHSHTPPNKIWFRTQQILIFLAHLLLLKWIFYALYEGGTMSSLDLLFHFGGMAIFGAGLIRLSAFVAKRNYEKVHNVKVTK